jgi:hypothetical protein
MKTARWVAIAGIAGFVACAGANMMPREEIQDPVPTAKGPPPPLDDDPSTKIDTLYTDLSARRAALSLSTPPRSPDDTCEPVCTFASPPEKPTQTPGCTVGAGSKCENACVEADAACDDAAQICEIAKGLRTDRMAAGRCREASATCTAAREPCCECKP